MSNQGDTKTLSEDSKCKDGLRIYVDAKGYAPFRKWIKDLKDKKAKALLIKRLASVRKGNLGDWKPLKGGLLELISHHGPGYRLYCSRLSDSELLLLSGSVKSKQRREMEKARQYLADFKQRVSGQEENHENVDPIRGDSR